MANFEKNFFQGIFGLTDLCPWLFSVNSVIPLAPLSMLTNLREGYPLLLYVSFLKKFFWEIFGIFPRWVCLVIVCFAHYHSMIILCKMGEYVVVIAVSEMTIARVLQGCAACFAWLELFIG